MYVRTCELSGGFGSRVYSGPRGGVSRLMGHPMLSRNQSAGISEFGGDVYRVKVGARSGTRVDPLNIEYSRVGTVFVEVLPKRVEFTTHIDLVDWRSLMAG